MLTRAEAIAACNALPDVFEDYPFHDPNWTVMRHRSNKKTFALIFEHQGHIWVNLKAQPEWVRFWQVSFWGPAGLVCFRARTFWSRRRKSASSCSCSPPVSTRT